MPDRKRLWHGLGVSERVTTVSPRSVVVIADSEAEARGLILHKMESACPPDDGWRIVQVEVALVPDDLVRTAAGALAEGT